MVTEGREVFISGHSTGFCDCETRSGFSTPIGGESMIIYPLGLNLAEYIQNDYFELW